MAVQLVTDEVLTERRAGWHTGRRKPWRLRRRPEIVLLLHYITSEFIVIATAASCNHKGVPELVRLDATCRLHSVPATVFTTVQAPYCVLICINQCTVCFSVFYILQAS